MVMKKYTHIWLAFGLVLAIILEACVPQYSAGSRVGTVNKLSFKGSVYKSWEGEMSMGGMRSVTNSDGNSTLAANVFEFSVDQQHAAIVVPKLQEAMRYGRRVELVYTQWAIAPFNQETKYNIVDVKEL